MSEAWTTALPSVIIGVLLLIVPGAVVIVAGWGLRSLRHWLLAPAVSVALIAASATGARLVGLRWSILPVAVITVLCAAAAYFVGRWTGRSHTSSPPQALSWLPWAAAGGGLMAAGVAISLQLASAFGSPGNISQTFDNIVHLNAIRLALDSGDASIFGIGGTSNIAWYPNGWHSVVTLVTQLGGASIPVAVNATSIALFAFAWPASVLALTATIFRNRPAALGAAAALSTGFGAFPLLLLYFGVLYPNATAYAILPAGVAAVWMLLSARRPDRLRHALLASLIVVGLVLAHPNALLALYAMTVVPTIWTLVTRIRSGAVRRDRAIAAAWMFGVLGVGLALWLFGRTNAAMSGWSAWQSTAQAFGEAALVSPRGYPITITTAALILIGLVTVLRHPVRWVRVGAPFGAAAFLFIIVSGVPAGTRLRDLFTSPWYNDSFRLAALLPAAGIPVAVIGALVVIDLFTTGLQAARAPRRVASPVVTVVVVALFSVAVGPNVTAAMADTRVAYRSDSSSALLNSAESALLDRLDDTTPADALIIVNPWTGGSLAFALAGRNVTALHVFGTRTPDQEFIDANLDRIDSDPRVCAAVSRVGAQYVLDFGDQNVFNSAGSGLERSGLNNLMPSSHLALIDSEGPSARLFRIEGC